MLQFRMPWGGTTAIFMSSSSRSLTVLLRSDPDLALGADSVLPGWKHRVSEFFAAPGALATYEYDFGDGWQHDVRFEGVVSQAKGTKYPRCTGGDRACPPEDCGGPDGYARMLEIICDPKHEEFASMRKWLGGHREPASA